MGPRGTFKRQVTDNPSHILQLANWFPAGESGGGTGRTGEAVKRTRECGSTEIDKITDDVKVYNV